MPMCRTWAHYTLLTHITQMNANVYEIFKANITNTSIYATGKIPFKLPVYTNYEF